jgi:hypothetical protein
LLPVPSRTNRTYPKAWEVVPRTDTLTSSSYPADQQQPALGLNRLSRLSGKGLNGGHFDIRAEGWYEVNEMTIPSTKKERLFQYLQI